MWATLGVCSAVLLGLYDAAKKQTLKTNGVLTVLLVVTALSTLFVSPFFKLGTGEDYLKLALKAVLVSVSWISGMAALKRLPLTVVSTVKGSRPMFVVLFSILLFGERLSLWQWIGVGLVFLSLYLTGRTSRGDGPENVRMTGFMWMGISVISGVASALYDKTLLMDMEPMFVQCWTNLFITILLALCLAGQNLIAGALKAGGKPGLLKAEPPLKWDWWLLVIAVLITEADALYFFALKEPDALLSVLSTIRRGSVVVTFICGVLFFKEKNAKSKSLTMLVMITGVLILLFAK